MKKIIVLFSGLIAVVLMSLPCESRGVDDLSNAGAAGCVVDQVTGAASCLSDMRLKVNVVAIEDALEKIVALQGVEFDWNEKARTPGQHGIGLIAQEVQQVFPMTVSIDFEGYKKLDYGALVAPLIEAVKEIDRRDSEEIKNLKEQNAALAKEQEILKQWICSQDPLVELCPQKAP